MKRLHLKKPRRIWPWSKNLIRRTDWRTLARHGRLPLGYRVARILGRPTPGLLPRGGTWLMRYGE
jgi:hypothetical protein